MMGAGQAATIATQRRTRPWHLALLSPGLAILALCASTSRRTDGLRSRPSAMSSCSPGSCMTGRAWRCCGATARGGLATLRVPRPDAAEPRTIFCGQRTAPVPGRRPEAVPRRPAPSSRPAFAADAPARRGRRWRTPERNWPASPVATAWNHGRSRSRPGSSADFPPAEARRLCGGPAAARHAGGPADAGANAQHRRRWPASPAACCCCRALRRRTTPATGLLIAVLVALPVNAAVTGALSAPHDRYQARLMWLPAFVAGRSPCCPLRRPAMKRDAFWSALEAWIAGTLSLVTSFLCGAPDRPGGAGDRRRGHGGECGALGRGERAVRRRAGAARGAWSADGCLQAFWASGRVGRGGRPGAGRERLMALRGPLDDARLLPMAVALALPLPLVGGAGVIQGLLTRERAYMRLALRTIIGQGLGCAVGICRGAGGRGRLGRWCCSRPLAPALARSSCCWAGAGVRPWCSISRRCGRCWRSGCR